MKKGIIVAVLMLNSCATMFNSGRQNVRVHTPGGEKVKTRVNSSDQSYIKKVPASVEVKPMMLFDRNSIEVLDRCYEPTITKIDRSFAGSFWLNAFNFFMFAGIDFLTGAMWDLNDSVTLDLQRISNCKS